MMRRLRAPWSSPAGLWSRPAGLVILVALVAGACAVYGWAHYSRRAPVGPAFEVKRGEFLDVLQFRGELKAMKATNISAPADSSDLQILKVAADGSSVKRGDVVVEFDHTKTQQDLAQNQSTRKSANAEMEQARAEGRLTEEANTTALMKARYDLEVAKLDASKSEIVSKLEGAEADLKMKDAEQKLREMEQKLSSGRAENAASLESKTHAGTKAAYDEQRAAHALANMTLTAPADGTIRLVSVWHDGSVGPFKAGDRAWSGSPIAELPDASTLRISARVDESERGRLALHQPATMQMDAIVDRQFTGRIEQISTIATSDFSAGWPILRNFNLEIAVDQKDSRLKPGMTTQITVIVDRMPDAITIPAQASFVKSGQTVAYVWDGSKFQERAIQVERRSRDRILVASGLHVGDLVALKDPSSKE